MSIIGKHAVRPLAVLATVAMLVTGLTCMSNPVDKPTAHAAELKPIYATARIVKKADGTGHGTAAQTFVNSKNGFAKGDDSPTDGVVSSGDTVEYSLTLNFSAAKKRVIRVGFDLLDAPYLETTDGGSFCQAGQFVTAKRNDDGSCSYTVPSAGAESMTQTFYLKAKDTGGVAQSGQIPKITVAREGQGGASATYRSDELTVVSAPAADLVIDNGGNPEEGRLSYERRAYWNADTDANGSFTIRADALTYPGYSTTKGASTHIGWTTQVDISDFPEGTVWTVDGQTVTRNADKEQHLTVSSGKNGAVTTIDYRIPADADALKNMKEGDVECYDVHLLPDETVFSVENGDGDTLLNMGSGGEPGWNIGRDKSTYDKDTGARVGYPYANNDWSRAIIQRMKKAPSDGTAVFDKDLQRPNTASRTMFDKENLRFEDAEGKADIHHYDGASDGTDDSGDVVSQGTQVKTVLTMRADSVSEDQLENATPTMQDEWDSTQMRWDGDLEVTQGGTPVTGYTFQWAAKDSDVWRNGEPSKRYIPTVGKVRVILNPDTLTVGSDAPPVIATFDTIAIANVDEGNVQAKDTLTAWLTEDDKESVDNWVWVTKPIKATAHVGIGLKAYDADGNMIENTDALTPGTRVDYTVNGNLNAIPLSDAGVLPTITVPKPKGLRNPTCADPFWQMAIDGDNLVFTPRSGKTTFEVDRNGAAALPELHFSGTVSNLATGTANTTASMSVDIDGNAALRAQTVQSNTATVPFTVSDAEANGGVIRAKSAKSEIGDSLTWEFNVYGRNGGHTGTMDSMLLLPADGDDKYVQDKLDEYDRGYSEYHGTYKLAQPVAVDEDNSTDTIVRYSITAGKTSDNPADYEWKTWNQLTDEDKTKVTAIRLTSAIAASDGQTPVSAVNGTIELAPSDNTKDDRYAMWLGRNYYSDADGKASGSQPWPAVAHVAAGSIGGTVWWDKDENTLIGKDEERVKGVEVTLSEQSTDGSWRKTKAVKTDRNGAYKFTLLRSGTYRTEVKREAGTVTSDGVQTQVKTYYSKLENVVNTRSWSSKPNSEAKDVSDAIHLGVGVDQTDVDYGYSKPDPKASVDKTFAGSSCSDTKCVVNWDVKIQNKSKSVDNPKTPPLKTFAVGSLHSLALDADGHLWAWGNNSSGQLGDGTTDNRTTPVKVKTDSTFTQIAAGEFYSLALDSDGHLWTWGSGYNGELGDGTGGRNVPVEVKTDSTFAQIAAGRYHVLALDSDGHLWSWGSNDKGQLGDGTTDNRTTPVKVKTDLTFTQIAAGGYHSLALDGDGHLWSWGSNGNGQVGDGTNEDRTTPVKVKSDLTFTQIAAGYNHSLALDNEGLPWAWGGNASSQLGDLSFDDQNAPVEVQVQNGKRFTQISAGGGFSSVLDSDGHLWTWGDSRYGKSSGTVTPYEIKTDRTFVQIVAGMDHSLVLDSDGHLWSFGLNNCGQLGNDTTDNQRDLTLVYGNHTWKSGKIAYTDTFLGSAGTSRFDTSSTVHDRMSSDVHDVSATVGTVPIESNGVKQVATSGDHKFVLTSKGDLYAWGDNQYGQLGSRFYSTGSVDSDLPNVAKPIVMDGLWSKIATGGKHSAAIAQDGKLYTTGWNGDHQLGDNTVNNVQYWWLEARVDKKFVDVACGNTFTLAVASDGTLWATGKSKDFSYEAWTQIGTGFTQISASMDTYIGLTTDGRYYYNGTYSSAVLDDTYKQVAAAYGTAYALTSQGNVREIGKTMRPLVSGLKDITRISCGYRTLYAIDKNQHLWAMGWNGDGQLANGSTGNGTYWTDGSASGNKDIVSTPFDTGIIASDVAGGDRDVLIVSKQVMIAGFDPYGDGKTGGARPVGLEDVGMGSASDPTAVPIEPKSETTADGMTTRTYNLPYSLEPGGYVIYHFTGTVERDAADMTGKTQEEIKAWMKQHEKTIINQAWFDSEHTPYSGTPHAKGNTTPWLPNAGALNERTHNVIRNETCRTDGDYPRKGEQHWFSTGAEDSCDQVGTVITPVTTAKKTGSISGLYWEDTDRDGIRSNGETKRFANQTVTLYDSSGKRIASTKTNEKGEYKFDHLDAGFDRYSIQFGRVAHRNFTKSDANDTDPQNDASSTDSDASTGDDDYGMATVSVRLTQDEPDKSNVDAGVLPELWSVSMPHTGMGLLLPLLMLVSIIGLVAGIILLRKEGRK